ncbi:hypothetical protein R4Y45_07140 [Holzapfeliella sp. He02]|uniref:DUF998 domain-containing protein n=1 Tax=Holzapfeliella saturejae TaxID=3082953 RepID=A0ABU8SJA5_9LACO
MKISLNQLYAYNRPFIIGTFIWLFAYSNYSISATSFLWIFLVYIMNFYYGINFFSLNYNISRKTCFNTMLLSTLLMTVFNVALVFCLNHFTSISINIYGFRVTNQLLSLSIFGFIIALLVLHMLIFYYTNNQKSYLSYIIAGLLIFFELIFVVVGLVFGITNQTFPEEGLLLLLVLWFVLLAGIFRYFILRIDISKKKSWRS